jgi:hypothetical protein
VLDYPDARSPLFKTLLGRQGCLALRGWGVGFTQIEAAKIDREKIAKIRVHFK